MTADFLVHTEPPPRWPDRTFLTSRAWLALMADRPPGRCHYFRLARAGVTVAATTGYLIDDPDCYESFNIYDLMWRDPPVFPDQRPPPARPADRSAWFPSLVLVQPGYDAGVVGEREPTVERVDALLSAIVGWAREAGAVSVAVLYAATPALVAALTRGPRWCRVRGTVRSRLDMPPGGFDGYLACLGKTHRKQVRCDLRDLARAGVRTEHLSGGEAGDTEIRLRMNLVEKYGGYSTTAVERARLARLRSLYPADRLRLFRCYGRGDAVLGFSLFIGYADEWHSFWCGFDYRAAASRWLYFDAMFYAPIRAAWGRQVRLIDYGLGYELSKRLRGCRAVARDIWVADLGGELGRWMRLAAVADGEAVSINGG